LVKNYKLQGAATIPLHSTSMKKNLSLLLAAVLFQACEFDQGLGLSPSKIAGRVLFLSTDFRPSNIDEVRVVAAANFPPASIADVFFSEAIRFDKDTANYEIILPYGTYPAVAVLWKPRGQDWALESLLGFYGFKPPLEASLKSVSLTREQPIAANIDVPALWSFAQFDARVEGDLTFIGAWPEDTEMVVMGGFNQVPDLENFGLSALAVLGGINFTLPKNVASYHYELAVRNGEYKFVGLFWKGRSIPWDKIRCLGYYRALNNPTQPGEFTLPPQGRITGIDFSADFNTLPEGVKLGGGL